MDRNLGDLKLQQNILAKRLESLRGKEITREKGVMSAGEVAVATSRAVAIETSLQTEIYNLKDRCERAEKQLNETENNKTRRDSAERACREARSEMELLTMDKTRAEDNLKDLQSKYCEVCTKVAELETSLNRSNRSRDAMEHTILTTEAQLCELQAKHDEQTLQLAHAVQDSVAERDVATSLQQRAESVESVLSASEAKLVDLSALKTKLETSLKRQAAELSRRTDEFQRRSSTQQETIETLQRQLYTLQDELSILHRQEEESKHQTNMYEEARIQSETQSEQLLLEKNRLADAHQSDMMHLTQQIKVLRDTSARHESENKLLSAKLAKSEELERSCGEELSRVSEALEIARGELRRFKETDRERSAVVMEAEQKKIASEKNLQLVKEDMVRLRAELTEANVSTQQLLSDLNVQRRGAEQAREAARMLAAIEAERDALQEELTQALLIQQNSSAHHTAELRQITDELQALRASEASLHTMHSPCGSTILSLRQQLSEEQLVNEKLSVQAEEAVDLRREVSDLTIANRSLMNDMLHQQRDLDVKISEETVQSEIVEARKELRLSRTRCGELTVETINRIAGYIKHMEAGAKKAEADLSNHSEVVRTLSQVGCDMEALHSKLQFPGTPSTTPLALVSSVRSRVKSTLANNLTDTEKLYLGLNTSTLPKQASKAPPTAGSLRELKSAVQSLETLCEKLSVKLENGQELKEQQQPPAGGVQKREKFSKQGTSHRPQRK
eukprot:TRINITY_DN31445_c0_g1_i1.p1 TRINITY_DN31445_c0_g1~~TRINITY_DN31445_c0_g1_i1.p1  ORF type:complete len:735 (+),score=150.94 TRINITY_DN31445_c0_g1_i1:73-2277(+)